MPVPVIWPNTSHLDKSASLCCSKHPTYYMNFPSPSAFLIRILQFILPSSTPPSAPDVAKRLPDVFDVKLTNLYTPTFAGHDATEKLSVSISSKRRSLAVSSAEPDPLPPGAKAGTIYLRNLSADFTQAFVTKRQSGGDDGWYAVPTAFNSTTNPWVRESGEVVVFGSEGSAQQRVGFYLDFRNVVTMITFRDFGTVDIQRAVP